MLSIYAYCYYTEVIKSIFINDEHSALGWRSVYYGNWICSAGAVSFQSESELTMHKVARPSIYLDEIDLSISNHKGGSTICSGRSVTYLQTHP